MKTRGKLPLSGLFDYLFRRARQSCVCQYLSFDGASRFVAAIPLRTERSKEQLVRRSLHKEKSCWRHAGEVGRAYHPSDCRCKLIAFFLSHFDARAFIRAPVDPELLINPMSASKGCVGGALRRQRTSLFHLLLTFPLGQ